MLCPNSGIHNLFLVPSFEITFLFGSSILRYTLFLHFLQKVPFHFIFNVLELQSISNILKDIFGDMVPLNHVQIP